MVSGEIGTDPEEIVGGWLAIMRIEVLHQYFMGSKTVVSDNVMIDPCDLQ